MNIKLDCEVIQDMLPLYEYNCCSEKTKILVEDHLKECSACKKTSELFHSNLPDVKNPTEDPDAEVIKNGMRKIKRKHIISCVIPVAVLIFIIFTWHALTPFQTSIPYENCKVTIMTIGEPEEIEVLTDFGTLSEWGQPISLKLEYSDKIHDKYHEMPCINILWENTEIVMDGETQQVVLINAETHELRNTWWATHGDLSEGTLSIEQDILYSGENTTDTVDAIYYVNNLNNALGDVYSELGAQPDEWARTAAFTELVQQEGYLVWSAE